MSNKFRLKLKPCKRCGKNAIKAEIRRALERMPYWLKYCQKCRVALAMLARKKRVHGNRSRILNRRLAKGLSRRF